MQINQVWIFDPKKKGPENVHFQRIKKGAVRLVPQWLSPHFWEATQPEDATSSHRAELQTPPPPPNTKNKKTKEKRINKGHTKKKNKRIKNKHNKKKRDVYILQSNMYLKKSELYTYINVSAFFFFEYTKLNKICETKLLLNNLNC